MCPANARLSGGVSIRIGYVGRWATRLSSADHQLGPCRTVNETGDDATILDLQAAIYPIEAHAQYVGGYRADNASMRNDQHCFIRVFFCDLFVTLPNASGKTLQWFSTLRSIADRVLVKKFERSGVRAENFIGTEAFPGAKSDLSETVVDAVSDLELFRQL